MIHRHCVAPMMHCASCLRPLISIGAMNPLVNKSLDPSLLFKNIPICQLGDVAEERYFSKTLSGDVFETTTLTVILLVTYISKMDPGV